MTDSLPLVISFYTVDTPYEEEVKYLQASCQSLGIDHHIEGIPSAGSWEMNCAFKPIFILQKMQEFKRPLLWVDADAVFLKPLENLSLFSEVDLGVRIYDVSEDHPSKIVSATVFVNATGASIKVVKWWAEECMKLLQDKNRKEEVWDQDALRRVLFQKEHGARFAPLPPSYSKILGHPKDEEMCFDPVIIQNQASRRYKKWINYPGQRFLG